jgi:glucose/mannose-6-phosphate isomerase
MQKIDLNSRTSIAQLDKSNLLGSIEELDKQIEHAWADTRKITVKLDTPIENVVVSGMGGSALGADVIKSVFKDQLKVPFEIVRDYTLPHYVGKNTLVLLSSYSGNTEETLACGEEARQKGAQVLAITAGGELAKLAQANHWPFYLIDPTHNPSGQPRMAIGYSIFGTIGLLEKAGVIQLDQEAIDQTTDIIRQQVRACAVEVTSELNPAKMLAYQLVDKQAVLIAPDFLAGATHAATNQSNENAKTLTTYHLIPEFNHHLLEALSFPDTLKSTHLFVLVHSKLAHPSNQVRIKLTEQNIATQNLETMSVNLEAGHKLAQCFELICLFSFISLYQAMMEEIDPSPIVHVEAFKQALKKEVI